MRNREMDTQRRLLIGRTLTLTSGLHAVLSTYFALIKHIRGDTTMTSALLVTSHMIPSTRSLQLTPTSSALTPQVLYTGEHPSRLTVSSLRAKLMAGSNLIVVTTRRTFGGDEGLRLATGQSGNNRVHPSTRAGRF
ncbi:hypothetical protein Pla100_14280 [Neorhodopirellula pilleata]|uniref:Uncharacterized protein n=2 Tax=Neorhodopirellula pilleata TaxID=2714738 RepID=A0A5C6ANS7_9BACT|nr:hypothetical protein Pla100_14280 [Neorhodopirellula pilleata]